MGLKPQKDPRYKLIAEKPRRYRDMITGEIIGRPEFEKRTKQVPGAVSTSTRAGNPRSQRKPLVYQGNPGASAIPEPPGESAILSQEMPGNIMVDIPFGAVPMADTPEPPPVLNAANAVAAAGYDVAQAAAQKTSDSLANIIGEAVALCANLVADIKAAPDKRYLVLETAALERVTKPAARIAMRHLPVNIEAVGPDGQDGAELFKGVMYCVTAIWANKQVFDAEMRKREEEYAKLYDAHYGAGSYQAARLAAVEQNAGNAGRNGTGQAQATAGNANQGSLSHGYSNAGAAGSAANGNGNAGGNGAGAASIIHSLYKKYPGPSGESGNLRPAV